MLKRSNLEEVGIELQVDDVVGLNRERVGRSVSESLLLGGELVAVPLELLLAESHPGGVAEQIERACRLVHIQEHRL